MKNYWINNRRRVCNALCGTGLGMVLGSIIALVAHGGLTPVGEGALMVGLLLAAAGVLLDEVSA